MIAVVPGTFRAAMQKILTIGIFICWTGLCSEAETYVLTLSEKCDRLNQVPNDERAPYVEFILITRNNNTSPEKRSFENGRTPSFHKFKPDKETFILISGATIFGKGYSFYYMSFFSHAFLKNGDYNIISVQWNRLIDVNLINQTLENAVFVGELTAVLINFLRNNKNAKGITIIGHHYGTIVAATASALLEKKLERLTALDPQPIPLNVELPHWSQLGRSCAEVVEVVHTTGYATAMGHRDFYPNGGKAPQPGCVFDFFDYCSTQKAFLLYGMDVIFNGGFFKATACENYRKYIGRKCDDRETISLWNRNNSNSLPTGSYFFRTFPETEQQQTMLRKIKNNSWPHRIPYGFCI